MIEIRRVAVPYPDRIVLQYRYQMHGGEWSEWKFVEAVTPEKAGVKVQMS